MDLASLAADLHDARRRGTRERPDVVDLRSIDDAYALQRELDALEGSARIGFKLGATLEAAIAMLGLEEFFHASLFEEHHHSSGSAIALSGASPVTVETEFVVVIGSDIKAGSADADPIDEAAVREATAAVLPGFELVATRFDMTLPGKGLHLVADSGGNHSTVIGESPDPEAWRELDFREHPAVLSIDGVRRAGGHSGHSLGGSPFAMVAALLERPEFAGRGLKRGELVYCGSCTGMLPVFAGNRLEADFGPLGRVTADLTAARPGR